MEYFGSLGIHGQIQLNRTSDGDLLTGLALQSSESGISLWADYAKPIMNSTCTIVDAHAGAEMFG